MIKPPRLLACSFNCRPSHIDVLLLAAVAEQLEGGTPYHVLSSKHILHPLGVTVGSKHDARCYSHDGACGSAFQQSEGATDELAELAGDADGGGALTPLSGLVLTAEVSATNNVHA